MPTGNVTWLTPHRGGGLPTPRARRALAAPAFLCTIRTDGERATVTPRGRLDETTIGHLETQVRRLCREGFSAIVLDLRTVTVVDPTGLALLHRADAIADRHGVALSLDLDSDDVDRLLGAPTA